MKQTKWMSFAEAVVNTLVGLIITFFAAMIIYPFHGVEMKHVTMLAVTIEFTILSVTRGYYLRRWFENGIGEWVVRKVTALWLHFSIWRFKRKRQIEMQHRDTLPMHYNCRCVQTKLAKGEDDNG